MNVEKQLKRLVANPLKQFPLAQAAVLCAVNLIVLFIFMRFVERKVNRRRKIVGGSRPLATAQKYEENQPVQS